MSIGELVISRTHNMNIVKNIMSHPSIWPHVHDDGVGECNPIDHEGFFWMLITELGAPIGVFLVHATNSICYQMHTCILPIAWGKKAKQSAKLLLKWAFDETNCQKMTTLVPSYNRAALRFAKSGGMAEEGVNRKSFLHNGELIDQIMLGITKEDWSCQQQYL